jgi:hypothetical protein
MFWLRAALSLVGWLIVNLDTAGWILLIVTVGLMTFELTRQPGPTCSPASRVKSHRMPGEPTGWPRVTPALRGVATHMGRALCAS